MRTMLQQLANLFADYIFPVPPNVRALEALTTAQLCEQAPPCVHTFAPYPITSLFEYNHELVALAVQEVKYFGNARVAALLGAILAQYVQKVVMGPTILVPIPLSRRRLRERGYNQVELIATACCTALPPAPRRLVQLEPDFLTKRHIKSQTTKDRGQRRSSIKNCFRTSQEKIKKYDSDQPIILIDDVITTGATLHEALATLATAGFTNVCALTIAHTALKRGMHDGSQAS